jgi:large subunit ribosomal protein L23
MLFYEQVIQDQIFQRELFNIIKYPIFTDKTVRLCQQNTYVFVVDSKARKSYIKYAIEQLFNVKVVSVNTSFLPLKMRRLKKIKGKKVRYKKAVVRVLASDSIDFF